MKSTANGNSLNLVKISEWHYDSAIEASVCIECCFYRVNDNDDLDPRKCYIAKYKGKSPECTMGTFYERL